MPTPIPFLDMGKFLKQLVCGASFQSSHYFTWCHCWRATDQYVNMIFTDDTLYNTDFKCFTRLPHQCPYPFSDITCENLVTVFRYPHKVVLNLINRMAPVSVFHATPPGLSVSQLKLTG